MNTPIILASSSPRRIEILKDLQIPFTAISSHFNEENFPFSGNPKDYVCGLARNKALIVAERYPSAIVIGADSIAYFNNTPLNKPIDRQQAEQFLYMLAGQWHSVYTGLCICIGSNFEEDVEEVRVLFNPLTSAQIKIYLDNINWQDKAGGYTLQKMGSLLVNKIEGCSYNVTGLPMNTLQKLFKRLGYDIWSYFS